jgi:hypothetical protein
VRSAILFLCCFWLSSEAFGQDCSNLKNESPITRDELVATSSEKLVSRSAAAVDEAEDNLKKELLVKLSEKILIEVESGSTNFIKDDGTALTQLFTSETKINSNTRLGNLRFEFCFDRKHKILFGRCRLDKSGLAESIAKDCISRLIALNAEITGFMRSGNSINVRPLVRKYEVIFRDFQSALFINHEISTQEWNLHSSDYNKAISAIANSDENLNLNTSIDQANDFIGKDEFEEALAILKNLRNQYKQNDDVEYAIEQCYERYLAHIRLQSAKLVQQHDYPGALELVDNYCAVAICSSDAKALREELRRGYFLSTADMLAASIRGKDDALASLHYTTLVSLADINQARAAELSERYKKYKIDRLIEKARIENDKRNYWEAFSLLRTTELSYDVSTDELTSLKEQLFRKIVALEIREEKKNRPHLNVFEFGPEVISNNVSTADIKNFQVNSMYLGFGAGLYFKYGFGPDHPQKGYPVRSDLVGIKARFINLQDQIYLADSESERVQETTGHIFECGADGVLMRIFHYNLSAVYNQDSHLNSPLGMSTSFGLRIPVHRFAMGIDGRYFNKFNDYSGIDLAAYVHGNLHFNRKFNRADKRQVRAKLRDY